VELYVGVDENRYQEVVSPYYRSLIKGPVDTDPVARQCLYSADEVVDGGREDALGERSQHTIPGLLHVYPDRVLVFPTNRCATNCRHCNRRWIRQTRLPSVASMLPAWIEYLKSNNNVDEVLITGGDPLTLEGDVLASVLSAVKSVGRVRVVRVGTRIPVVSPHTVSRSLAGLLSRFNPIYLHTQFNALAECTKESARALECLADAGINLGNQMVLLGGVNDSVEQIMAINRWLVEHRCRPYYLFYPEAVKGTLHFRIPLRDAAELADELWRRSSGLALPRVVVDTPDGGGKVPLSVATLIEQDGCLGVRDRHGRFVAC
jgi:KamA family protein